MRLDNRGICRRCARGMRELLAENGRHRRCREPGYFAARVLIGRRPGSWIAEWMDRRVVRALFRQP